MKTETVIYQSGKMFTPPSDLHEYKAVFSKLVGGAGEMWSAGTTVMSVDAYKSDASTDERNWVLLPKFGDEYGNALQYAIIHMLENK